MVKQLFIFKVNVTMKQYYGYFLGTNLPLFSFAIREAPRSSIWCTKKTAMVILWQANRMRFWKCSDHRNILMIWIKLKIIYIFGQFSVRWKVITDLDQCKITATSLFIFNLLSKICPKSETSLLFEFFRSCDYRKRIPAHNCL